MLSFFKPLAATDTIHVEVSIGSDSVEFRGDTIPNRLFFTTVPAEFLEEIEYLADSSQALVLGKFHFSLDDNLEAYLVEFQQFWFQNHSLFLYDKSLKKFTKRITLAEWYGGDGGQVLTGSWVFDFDGDGKKDIVRREIQHSILPGDDEPEERTDESAAIFLWKNGGFVDFPVRDSADIFKKFPIKTFW